MKLEELRKKIDDVDASIANLIAERIGLAEQIGRVKREQGQQIEDVQREERILTRIRRLAKDKGIKQADIENIYHQIFTATKSIQGGIVAFQGELGAYSEEAAVNFFGTGVQVRPYEKLESVFRAVEQDEVQFGIAPIENSLEGSISKTYDLLLDSSLKVCGEIELKVSHCLIVNPGVTLDAIKKIYSHPQALGQCQAFIKHLDCELIPTYDTAGSVKMIKEKGMPDGAAIAGIRAAEIYKMKVIAHGIEDNPNNFTRFFILAKEDAPPTGNDKTSVVFSVKHKPGALFGFLEEMAAKKVNLTKIESRPTRQKPWDYNFYLDFEGHREDKAPREALKNLEDYATFIKVLGSYPRANKSNHGAGG
jgi:chorismate mutase/prephenate dehydratase